MRLDVRVAQGIEGRLAERVLQSGVVVGEAFHQASVIGAMVNLHPLQPREARRWQDHAFRAVDIDRLVTDLAALSNALGDARRMHDRGREPLLERPERSEHWPSGPLVARSGTRRLFDGFGARSGARALVRGVGNAARQGNAERALHGCTEVVLAPRSLARTNDAALRASR